MAANLDLGNNKIINVSNPSSNNDVVNKFYTDHLLNNNIYLNEIYTSKDGSGYTIGPFNRLQSLNDINMTNHNIINLADPSQISNNFLQSAVTINYLNTIFPTVIKSSKY